MKSLQLNSGSKKMFDIHTFFNLRAVRWASILFTVVCIGYLFSCSADVSGPKFNFSGNGFKITDSDFTEQKTFDAEIPVENQTRLNLEAISGEVVVTGHSDADTVVVTALLLVGSNSQEDAEIHLEELDIRVTDSADEILIQTVQPQDFDGRKYNVEYDIIVPSSLEVMATQDNGHIEIIDIQNSVDVSNTNGGVLLSDIAGGVMAVVGNGSIEATVFLPVDKTIDLSTNNGNLELNIPSSTSAEFSATVVNGEINATYLDFTDAVNTNHWLNGVIGDGEGTIELSTTNGNIDVIGFD